ncbi:endothelin-converting enzyme 1-like [Dermacentor andersoni]|uniref:endothelin-converting enzyme 1-like n=1 Tax=Dermacentor andersoni TaxID=34620 RepID=UPI003B3B70DC
MKKKQKKGKKEVAAHRPNKKIGRLYQPQHRITLSAPPPHERLKLGKRSTLVAALLAVAVAVCVVSAVAVPIARRVRRAAQLVGLCETTACTSYARMMAQSTSGSVNPCHNFYRFVCEGYANSSRSVFRDHVDTFTSLVGRSLRTAVAPESGQSAFEKAAVFYQSCVAVVAEGTNQFDQFRAVIIDAGILWPQVSKRPNIMASMLKMAVTLNIFTLVFFAAEHDGEKCLIEIWKGDVLEHLKRRRRELEADGKYQLYYDTFIQIFEGYDKNATMGGSLLASATSGSESTRWEYFLQIENVAFHYLTGRKAVVKTVFDDVGKLKRISPSISPKRWAHLFGQMMFAPLNKVDNLSSPSLPCSQEITVWDLQYLRALDDLLLAVGEQRLHFYYGWTVVQALARFMSYGLAVLSYGSAKAARDESSLHCLRLTEATMGLVVYERYAARYFSQDIRVELHEMVNVVYSALLRSIQAIPELDVRDTSMGLRQLERTLLPNFEFLDNKDRLDRLLAQVPSMVRRSFAHNWLELQRALRHMSSEVRGLTSSWYLSRIAAASGYSIHKAGNKGELGLAPYLTLLPLYDASVVDSVKYGGLGSLIAEATFQFFEEHLPLQSSFRSRLEQRTRCYESAGPLRDLQGDPVKRAAFKRAISQSFLWQAFQSPLRRRDYQWRLHGLEYFSEQQLFFMASCFPLCSGYQSGIAELTCNEPLRHSRHFPGAFRCPGGAPMNPRLKCSVFY